MELGWGVAIQAAIVAVSTWYVRKGSHEDANAVKKSTAAQTTSDAIHEKVVGIEADVRMLKKLVGGSIDHRGPSKE